MYSRKTGTLYNQAEIKRKTDSFNDNLREQYRHRQATPAVYNDTEKHKPSVTEGIELGINDNVILIGLIMLLLGEENKDYLLIGALALLLFLNK